MTYQSKFVASANLFQVAAHGAVGQKRKFSGKPYHVHPQAVHDILIAHHPEATEHERAAALLHDVIEDTGIPYELIAAHFGEEVADIVLGLTNFKMPGMNRTAQKKYDAQRLEMQDFSVKLIKLCDRLHNLPDIIQNDPSHARVYVAETRYLLDTALIGVGLLDGAGHVLWMKLDTIVKNYYAETQKVA